MEIGINLFCYGGEKELNIEKQIELMTQNGFNHTFIMGDSSYLTGGLVDKVKRAGISFDTLHAPFDGINSMWRKGEEGEEMLSRLIACVERCADFDIPVAVVHLSSGRPAPAISDIGNSRFARLMEEASKKNVTLAFENQRFVANIASIMEQHKEAGFCWDVGHEGCFTKGIRFMPLFGDRLTAIHVHDNHHLADEDEHLIPFDGITDFDFVAQTLASHGFCGSIMLEVFRSESDKYELLSPKDYYERAGRAARSLAGMVEEKKLNL